MVTFKYGKAIQLILKCYSSIHVPNNELNTYQYNTRYTFIANKRYVCMVAETYYICNIYTYICKYI